MTKRVLYVVVTGAGPAVQVGKLIRLARDQGWSVHAVPTAAALEYFVDASELEELTQNPVRTNFRRRGESGGLPRADAVIVAPATYNTINKWALGVCDTYQLSVLAEITGLGKTPIVVLPFVNEALAANEAFGESIERLRKAGVKILLGPGGFEPHPPRAGAAKIDSYPWHVALEALKE